MSRKVSVPAEDHLTRAHGPLMQAAIDATFEGQAGWAVDETRTCRECLHWRLPTFETRVGPMVVQKTMQPYSREGELRERPCAKARQLVGHSLPRVHHAARACRWFEENPDAPAISIDPRTTSKGNENE